MGGNLKGLRGLKVKEKVHFILLPGVLNHAKIYTTGMTNGRNRLYSFLLF